MSCKVVSVISRRFFRGLTLLHSARYHQVYKDYRIFPVLHQYVQAINFVEDSLSSVKDDYEILKDVYESFVNAVEQITLGNGIYVINWKNVPECHFTFTKSRIMDC